MVKLSTSYVGPIDREWAAHALRRLLGLYAKVEEPPLLVYVVFVHDAPTFKSYLALLHEEAGVASAPAYDGYEATHDAFTGAPRITLCEELIKREPEAVQDGIILHEGAHSVLHGELRFYEAGRYLRLLLDRGVPQVKALNLLYLLSVAVKDYEATKLLVEKGFVEPAKAYAQRLLKRSEESLHEWGLSLRLGLEDVHLAELLKPLCCSAPLARDVAILEAAKFYVSHLPPTWAERLLSLAFEGDWREGGFEDRLSRLALSFMGLLRQLKDE
mgnify:CR=1 FL=1